MTRFDQIKQNSADGLADLLTNVEELTFKSVAKRNFTPEEKNKIHQDFMDYLNFELPVQNPINMFDVMEPKEIDPNIQPDLDFGEKAEYEVVDEHHGTEEQIEAVN